LAQDIDGSVLLNAHPSLSGIASGDGRSGSTAWNNSCRSRWSLTRPEDAEGKPILDSPERILTRRKANAASTGDAITMEWIDGVFVVPEKYTAGSGSRKDQAEAVFLAALDAKRRAGLHVSAKSRAGNYAPKVFHDAPEGRDSACGNSGIQGASAHVTRPQATHGLDLRDIGHAFDPRCVAYPCHGNIRLHH
jgi:hypothetical protein